jgi:hypothetical protein
MRAVAPVAGEQKTCAGHIQMFSGLSNSGMRKPLKYIMDIYTVPAAAFCQHCPTILALTVCGWLWTIQPSAFT